ncbi:ABC transporter ATP-binding protein [Methylosinus sporium]|uniref:ABC transporter ATP-binding protein n=1 Tax=Methylosinus sporium TaxID=428 RepID=UPI00383AFC30
MSAYLTTLRFALRYWLLSPRLLAAMLVARLVSNVVDVFVPVASGHLADVVAGESRELAPALSALAVFLGTVLLFHCLRNFVAFSVCHVAAHAMAALVRDAFARVQRFSADWHANAFAGATVRKITRGVWAFDSLSDTLIFGMLPAATVIVAITCLLSWRWPLLGLVVAIGISLFLAMGIGLSLGWISPAAQVSQALDSAVSARLADSITGNQIVKGFAAEKREDASFTALVTEWRKRTLISWYRGTTVGLLQAVVMIAMQATLLGCGLMLWSQGGMSTGDVVSLIGIQGLINGYLRDIGEHVRNLQRAVNEMEDVVEFDAQEPDVVDAPGATPLAVTRGEIVFDNVTFGYPNARRKLYENFSLTIRPGQRVGLVGASGAGKTTFVKLLQRQFDLDAGRILIDGQDIAFATQASLREAIGIVAQEPILFHRPLGENIAYGRPDAAQYEVAEAARLAHANMFIERLPDAYETLVGERGVKLSGGERQRVAIARAILAATPILVLDEATSSLDSLSEFHIRAAIEQLSAGRTTIVVAHRLSTVQRLDRILVFDHGRIVEDGAHEELLGLSGGVYRRLFDTQLGAGDSLEEAIERAG